MKDSPINLTLENKLKGWDGIRLDYLTELYDKNYLSVDFFQILINLCLNCKELQKATTWLIKQHYQKGQTLPNYLIELLLSSYLTVENWEAKLHLLQVLPYLELSKNSIRQVEKFCRNCLTEKNKFVKAWAYNGLYELIKYLPELKNELEYICQSAYQTESPAIKSRIKKILLKLNTKIYSLF